MLAAHATRIAPTAALPVTVFSSGSSIRGKLADTTAR
jgi:hypothetical protein